MPKRKPAVPRSVVWGGSAVLALTLLAAAPLQAAIAYIGSLSGRLYRVPPSGVAQLITTLPGQIAGVSRSSDGKLFVCVNAPAARIFEVADSGVSRSWLIAAAYPLSVFLPASRQKFTARAHWLGWSAYLIARRPLSDRQ